MANDFNYEIVERVAVLSTQGDYTKELNKVSYNGAAPKLDIRKWKRTNGEEQMMKGITLSDEEAELLLNGLNGIYPSRN